MTTPEAIIPALLFDRLAALTLSPALPIAWPNVAFAGTGAHLEVQYLPNRNVRPFVADDGETIHQGLLQVSVVTPLDAGITPALETAGLVVEYFPAGLALSGSGVTARVTAKPSVAPPLTEAATLRTPVTIPWRALV